MGHNHVQLHLGLQFLLLLLPTAGGGSVSRQEVLLLLLRGIVGKSVGGLVIKRLPFIEVVTDVESRSVCCPVPASSQVARASRVRCGAMVLALVVNQVQPVAPQRLQNVATQKVIVAQHGCVTLQQRLQLLCQRKCILHRLHALLVHVGGCRRLLAHDAVLLPVQPIPNHAPHSGLRRNGRGQRQTVQARHHTRDASRGWGVAHVFRLQCARAVDELLQAAVGERDVHERRNFGRVAGEMVEEGQLHTAVDEFFGSRAVNAEEEGG